MNEVTDELGAVDDHGGALPPLPDSAYPEGAQPIPMDDDFEEAKRRRAECRKSHGAIWRRALGQGGSDA